MLVTEKINKSIILLLMSIFFSFDFAHAACTSPAANAGNLQMHGTLLKYCDGTNWLDVNGTSTGVSCTGNTGRIENRSGELQYCNGTNWIATANAIDHGSCAAQGAGYFYYSSIPSGAYYSNLTFYWFCDGGTQWRRMGTGVL